MSNDSQKLPTPDLRWFECNGIHIAIDRASSSALPALGVAADKEAEVMDLIDAVLLDEQDPLLRFMDDWFSTVFDWKPWQPTVAGKSATSAQEIEGSQEPPATATPVPLHQLNGYPRLTASLSSLEGAPRKLLLAIDEGSLENLPAVPEAWESLVAFKCFVMPYQLQLQQMDLSAQELDKLGPGGLVLLPQSFESRWQVTMLASRPDSILKSVGVITAIVDTVSSRVRLLPQAGSDASSESIDAVCQSISVQLDEPMPINELYARSVWQAQLNLVLALPHELLGSRVVIRSEADPDATLDLSGTLMKVGTGYGVLLEQVSAQLPTSHSLHTEI